MAGALARWKHLAILTQPQQETLLTKDVIEKSRRQQLMILVLLVIVTAVIIALIIYTLTMDNVRSIATLKFIGAPDRTIVGLIVQQALAMGIISFTVGLTLILIFQGYFPRRLVILPGDVAVVFAITVAVCLAASSLGVRVAVKIDPAVRTLCSGVKDMVEANPRPAVCVERLFKYFGAGEARVDALCAINMEVFPGQVVGLMGPSGSGKTTLLNCIACILEPSSGRLTLDGEMVYYDRWLKADLRRLRLDKIGFIFQYPNLLPFLDATDNVAEVLYLAGLGYGAGRSRAIDLLDYLEVGHRRDAMPAQLSGGEAQRVAIARAGEPAAHHPGRRADRAAQLGACAHRDGLVAQDCGGPERGDHLRDP